MKVAIVGYGIEGQESYRYYKNLGHDVVIVDENTKDDLPEGLSFIIGEDAFDKLQDFDLIIRSPSIRPDRINTKGKIWSATNEFFEKCPAKIIGVTGTKGKGTTCSFIASILRTAGRKVHLVGNIGTPALKTLPNISSDDYVVYELSSFQLWDLQKSPHIAVVLPIEPDHQDVHISIDEYINAKGNISKNQTADDFVIYYPTNEASNFIATRSNGIKKKYSFKNDGVYVNNGNFYLDNKIICSTNAMKLAGSFNLDNACAAISACLIVDSSVSKYIEAGLESFDGLPHRLKLVRTVNGIRYFDNSIATTPGSSIASIKEFANDDLTVILGGSDKGTDYSELVHLCKAQNVKVVAIGYTGEEIAKLCKNMEVDFVRERGNMNHVIDVANRITPDGGVVLLSPASASFDQYSSYSDRGDKYIEIVNKIKQKSS